MDEKILHDLDAKAKTFHRIGKVTFCDTGVAEFVGLVFFT